MTEHAVLDELRQAIDEAFQGRERVAMRDVYAQASRHVSLPADLLGHLNELPEGAYDRQELTEAINAVITRRGEQDTLGLLEVPGDDASLDYLNPTPTRPEGEDR
ncbi:hypothetical protein ABZW11_04195 [Nonomuraea sp. NPDC004580]|uniref:hypothetical protein n=1 Tax=Nonomuraea sp. NPDC004580 TaxID=3154552 RepID=UPI0033ACBE0E